MSRRPLIAGNWKMHMNLAGAVNLAREVAQAAERASDRDVMIAPPFTALASVAEALRQSPVLLGAQNVCWEEKGAFTGEISPTMLADIGCSMAIVGHSERRHIFGEQDAMINKRINGALHFGLTPVFCIGETLTDREAGKTFVVLESQLRKGLAGISLPVADRLVVAYEPVWAIGTGKTATAEQAQEAHAFVREVLENVFEKNIASQIRILYGGSVNVQNVDGILSRPDVDGALVGGAALNPDTFKRIVEFQ